MHLYMVFLLVPAMLVGLWLVMLHIVLLLIPAMLVRLRAAGDVSLYGISVHTCHVSETESGW